MAANGKTRQELLQNMQDIEKITQMLSKLKSDLKNKEGLLKKMESALSKSESRLEKKVAEIDEKTKRLDEIEGKLVKRGEELTIQEEEVQINAILEFLSFQARELEIQEKAKTAPDPDDVGKFREKIEKLEESIREKERQIEEIRNSPGELAVAGEESEELTEKIKKVDEYKEKLDKMKTGLEQKEIDLIRREEEVNSKLRKSSQAVTEEDKKAIEALGEREKQLMKLEEQIRNKQREINQFMEGLDIKDQRIKELENEVKIKEELLTLREETEELSKGGAASSEVKEVLESEYQTKISMIESNYKNMIDSLKGKNEKLKVRNEELEMLGDQLSAEKLRVTLLERELKERMNEISFSEERLARRQELMLKERKQIDEQMKKMKETSDGSEVALLNEELANRQKQMREIEQKLREKEEYLRKREQDLSNLRSDIIDQEMKVEISEATDDLNRVRTGVRRFDDLCYGGFPFNSNYILYGPAYSGRKTFTNLYIAEGMKKGIPTIYVTTQHTPSEIKDQLRTIIPKIDAYEEKGLMKFIDIYSKSMGIEDEYPNTIYVEKPTDLDGIENAISEFQEEFKGKHAYHKMVFFSVSTLLTYIEPLSIFRFFQVLNSKNKRNNAVSIYVVDTGMHKASDIQTLKHTMNGFIEFKLDDLKYYLRVEGGGDVMSRAWIEYTFTDKTFDLRGSFSLDHIR